ncbi:Cpn10 domain containing protein [Trichuris trichiura]|uniref:10 kDa heat shock protein, mitochondrial n=1 Tax=Trichuris trichiura TaxID=36087 RepID=A0A077Z6Q7_TRITR|nr:Cpn10 domain containing protein [Trichuris trichiura]
MQTTEAVRKFTPLFDRLLVERFAPETKTKGGIMIPEKAQGKVLEATVLAAGSGSRTEEGKTIPLTVKVGDRVLLPEYGGTKIVMDEKVSISQSFMQDTIEYYIFRESDILGKWNE